MNYDFLSVSNGSGDAALMHVNGAGRLTGATTIPVDTVVNVPAKFIGTYGTVGPDGYITAATKRDFRGHVSGSSLVIDGFEAGSTDAGNTAGQIVIVKPNTGWANRVATFIKNATGNGTPEAATFAGIAATGLTVTGAIAGTTIKPTTAVLLDGLTNATYRYQSTTPDISTKRGFYVQFAHGLSYTPWVTGRVYTRTGSVAHPLPWSHYDPTDTYWPSDPALTASLIMVIMDVDATNITVRCTVSDSLGFSILTDNFTAPGFRFQFYCSPQPGA